MTFHRAAVRHFASLVVVALALPPSAQAAPTVATRSAVFVERQIPGQIRRLEPASALNRGDRVVTILAWQRVGGNDQKRGFTITNPLPRVIAYQKSARPDEEVSVDGGRTWGRLGDLRIADRIASPEDVTHVRWRISPLRAALGRGQIAYSGIVR